MDLQYFIDQKVIEEFPFWHYKFLQLSKKEIKIVADSFFYHIIGKRYSYSSDFMEFFHELIDAGILKYPLELNFNELIDETKIYHGRFFNLLQEYGMDFVDDLEKLTYGNYNIPKLGKSNELIDNIKNDFFGFIDILCYHRAILSKDLEEYYYDNFFGGFDEHPLMISASVFKEENMGEIIPSQNEIKRYSRHGLTGINLKEIHKSKYLHGTIDLFSIVNISYPEYYWIKGNRNDRNLCLLLADNTVYQGNLPSYSNLRYFDKEWSHGKKDKPKYKLNFTINEFFQINIY